MSLRCFVCCAVALWGATLAAPAGASIPTPERNALIALYNSTGGPTWKTSTGWNGAAGSECAWFGVFCDDKNSTVIAIDLHDNHLTGTLTALDGWPNLRAFLVYNNQIGGSIPAFGNLPVLEEFIASGNQLSGAIPALGGLTALIEFDVSGNQLTGAFPSISGLARLQSFVIGSNQLSGAVPALANLAALQTFDISANGFSGALPALDGVPSLQIFYGYTNQFSGAIPSLAAARSLQQFVVSENQLTGPVPALNGLSNLQLIDVDQNQLSGTLPALSGAGLSALQYFDASSNQLTGTIPALSGLNALQTFNLRFNKLTGSIPALSGLTSLQLLDLGDNQLSGTIPPLTNLPALTGFSFELNQLTGPLPALDALTSVTYINVQYNQLSGTLPSLSALKSLQTFAAAANDFSGNIPSLSGLAQLQTLEVQDNALTGHVPDLSGLTALQDLEIEFNQLDGPLPSLAGLNNLQQLVINDNRLSGTLPSFAGLTNLQGIYAGGNQFSGAIPSLAGLTKLERFYLDGNQLTGNAPDLAGLSQLQYFSVSGNKLTGTLPALSGSTQLVSFDASYNQIGGTIPSLAGLSKLQTLYLGFNRLSGGTPSLAGLSALQIVAVDDNQLDGTLGALAGANALQSFQAGNNALTGSIPPLTGLNELVEFNVAMNHLSGNLPSLAGLTKLQSFDASYNQLNGPIPTLAGLSSVQQFHVGFNQLTGSIPSLSGLSNLQYFAVDDNLLTGNLPTLTGLGKLIAFLAASNEIEGTIPPLTGLSNLQLFQVGNNRLSGNIPSVPSPDNLTGGLSSLCPNNLALTNDGAWDDATGEQPWYSICQSNESQEAKGATTTKDSTNIAFSRDGAIEVFQSQQTDLTSNAANSGGQDVYTFSASGVQLESIDQNGNKLIGVASAPAISPDGQAIAFLFAPGAAAKERKEFVTGQVWAGARGQPKHQVDVGMGGVPADGPAATTPTLASIDGTNQLAFCSAATNLVPNDTNAGRDIFLADPLNASTALQRLSVDGAGAQLPGDSCEPKLSSNGTKLVFSLSAQPLYGTAARQIVLKNLGDAKLRRAGKILFTGQIFAITANGGGQGAPADSSEPSVSRDGSVVAFTSTADLDGLGAPVGGREVFMSLAQPQSSTRLIRRARSGDGSVPDGASQRPQITDDGTAVVMQTAARNFLLPKGLSKAVDDTAPSPQCGAIAITTNYFSVKSLGGALCTSDGKTLNQSPSISGDGSTSGFDSNAEQSNGNTNRNAFAQGVGSSTGVTPLPNNLSGDYSGQWFDPNQSGQGLVIDVLRPDAGNNRAVLLTWFVYSNGQPTWVQAAGVAHAGSGTAGDTVVVQMDQVGIFRGASFPLGEPSASGSLWGSITLAFTDANTGNMSWHTSYPGFSSGSMPIKHFVALALPENDASGAQITSCISGNWFNPVQSGHGFEFEVLPTSPAQLAVDWFAFAPDGSPVWLYGSGPISGNSAQMHLILIDGTGAQFPPNFNPGGIVQHDWGTATFTFADTAHASVTWNSTFPGYGSGTQPLQPIFGAGLIDRRGCP